MTDEQHLAWLEEQGYVSPRIVDEGKWIAMERMLFGAVKILRGQLSDSAGYSDEWMYPSSIAAALAFSEWNGQGDPDGWVRHKPSNRRISQSPDEYDENGRRVGAVGVVYLRP